MIVDLNKQRVTSDFIELFQLEIATDTYVYFTNYHEPVNFRDTDSPFTSRTFIPLPVEFSGFQQTAEGAYSRPKVTFANILTTFSDALDGATNDDLLGKKVIRRRTLYKYLATGTVEAPTELPVQVFIIDRLEGLNAQSVTFELASPFDLAGVVVPSRIIIPNTCSWAYQGGALDRSLAPLGGCSWKEANNNNGFAVYIDNKNFLFIDSAVHTTSGITTYSTARTKNNLYKTAVTLIRANADGSVTTGISGYSYWQALSTATASFVASQFRRCRQYSAYDSGTAYYTYKSGEIYNDCVLSGGKIWVCIKSHASGQTPGYGSLYWKRVDACGKKLSSCAMRFKSGSVTISTGAILAVEQDNTKVLPYGGFPASRRYGY